MTRVTSPTRIRVSGGRPSLDTHGGSKRLPRAAPSAIRANTGGEGVVAWNSPLAMGPVQRRIEAAASSFRALAELGAPLGVSVLIENHGRTIGKRRTQRWRCSIERTTLGLARCPTSATLPKARTNTRRSKPCCRLPRGVSAKTFDFDADGRESTIDYDRMMDLVARSGYDGYVGIEYEGPSDDEQAGIAMSLALLERYVPRAPLEHKSQVNDRGRASKHGISTSSAALTRRRCAM